MRKIVSLALLSALLPFCCGIALAIDLGQQREASMKAIANAAKTGFGMASGKTPFDAAAASKAMALIAAEASAFPSLFPEGSDKADPRASPEIWRNRADFEAHAKALADSATAAGAAAGQGADAFKSAFAAVGGSCQGCHQRYRLKS